VFDVILLNRYFGWYVDSGDLIAAERRLEDELRLRATRYDKPIVITEFGADAVAGMHISCQPRSGAKSSSKSWSPRTWTFARIENVVGDHVWNFADFATMQGSIRVIGNRKGVFTCERTPKAVAYLLRERWSEKPATS